MRVVLLQGAVHSVSGRLTVYKLGCNRGKGGRLSVSAGAGREAWAEPGCWGINCYVFVEFLCLVLEAAAGCNRHCLWFAFFSICYA
jgi:hypothetical protein